MNLKPFLIFLFIILFNSCNKIQNDLDRMKLKGDVKEIKESIYEAVLKFGKYEKSDLLGITRETNFNKEGNIEVDQISILFTKFYRKDVYNYDLNGNLNSISNFNAQGKLISKYTYNHNVYLNEIESDKFDSKGKFIARYITRYDSLKNKILTKYNSNGDFVFHYIYKYNEKGEEIERVKKNGNWYMEDKFTSYFENGEIKTVNYTVFSESNLEELNIFYDLEYINKEKWTSTCNSSNYIYDYEDNWIMKFYCNSYIVEREITYY